jgi:hypothetical protein
MQTPSSKLVNNQTQIFANLKDHIPVFSISVHLFVLQFVDSSTSSDLWFYYYYLIINLILYLWSFYHACLVIYFDKQITTICKKILFVILTPIISVLIFLVYTNSNKLNSPLVIIFNIEELHNSIILGLMFCMIYFLSVVQHVSFADFTEEYDDIVTKDDELNLFNENSTNGSNSINTKPSSPNISPKSISIDVAPNNNNNNIELTNSTPKNTIK